MYASRKRFRLSSFFWREPGALVLRAKEAGAIVLHTVASANMARRAVESGVDVVVAQGWEAGGHVRGTVATLPLIPAVVDVVARLPWLPPAALRTVAGSPPCSHSAPRAHGSAPDFSLAGRRPYIRATASGCLARPRTTPFSLRSCSNAQGIITEPGNMVLYVAGYPAILGLQPLYFRDSKLARHGCSPAQLARDSPQTPFLTPIWLPMNSSDDALRVSESATLKWSELFGLCYRFPRVVDGFLVPVGSLP